MQKQRNKSDRQSRPIVTFPAGRNQPIRGCSIGNLKQTEQNEVNGRKGNEFGKKGENEQDVGKKKMEDGGWKGSRVLRIQVNTV